MGVADPEPAALATAPPPTARPRATAAAVVMRSPRRRRWRRFGNGLGSERTADPIVGPWSWMLMAAPVGSWVGDGLAWPGLTQAGGLAPAGGQVSPEAASIPNLGPGWESSQDFLRIGDEVPPSPRRRASATDRQSLFRRWPSAFRRWATLLGSSSVPPPPADPPATKDSPCTAKRCPKGVIDRQPHRLTRAVDPGGSPCRGSRSAGVGCRFLTERWQRSERPGR